MTTVSDLCLTRLICDFILLLSLGGTSGFSQIRMHKEGPPRQPQQGAAYPATPYGPWRVPVLSCQTTRLRELSVCLDLHGSVVLQIPAVCSHLPPETPPVTLRDCPDNEQQTPRPHSIFCDQGNAWLGSASCHICNCVPGHRVHWSS